MVAAGRLGLVQILARVQDLPRRRPGDIGRTEFQLVLAEQIAFVAGHAVLADGFPVHGRPPCNLIQAATRRRLYETNNGPPPTCMRSRTNQRGWPSATM